MPGELDGITFEPESCLFVPVEGTLSPDALAKPANWMPYAIDLSPYLAGPITVHLDNESATYGPSATGLQ